MTLKRIFLLLSCLLTSEAVLATLHCGNRLVDEGDPQYYVANHCPRPFWVERWTAPESYDYYSGPYGGYNHARPQYEAWYINFGARKLMRRLVFYNGYLVREQTLGRGVGFRPGSRSCSARELGHAGETAGEIFANCGEPDHIYDEPVQVYPNRRGAAYGRRGGIVVYRTRWIYNYGSRRSDRELTFEDGRLLTIRELDY